jgi:hypothetical protein
MMKKTINLNVPNELWVDDFSEGKTQSFTYDGPEKLWLSYAEDGQALSVSEQEPVGGNRIEINVSSASNEEMAAVILLTQNLTQYEYEFEDELNHDGSIYKKITNPKLSDFYQAFVLAEKVILKSVVKDSKNLNFEEAVYRKAYVKKYAETYDFELADKTQIDSFLTSIDAYIETIKTAYPWKYVTVDTNEIPKIPVSLVKLFSQLPNPSVR